MTHSLAYLSESRDWHGRWTSGDAGTGASPDRADIVNATYTIVAQMPVAQSSSVESSLHHGGREALANLLQSMLGIGTAHADTLKERLQASGMNGARRRI
jgi:hypothetical protein